MPSIYSQMGFYVFLSFEAREWIVFGYSFPQWEFFLLNVILVLLLDGKKTRGICWDIYFYFVCMLEEDMNFSASF